MQVKTTICVQCGKELTQRQITCHQQFCSRQCYADSMKNDIPEVRCLTCGRVLSHGKAIRGHKYCSRDCASRGAMVLKRCAYCGKVLDVTVSNRSRYCSEECKLAIEKNRSRDNADEISGEAWGKFPLDNRYEVSTMGRVRNVKSQRIRVPMLTRCGYLKIMLHNQGSHKCFYVHRMVMETFCGFSDLEVSHINGKSIDNRLENLLYEDHKSNMQRAVMQGSMHGCVHHRLSDSQIMDIYFSKEKGVVLARQYGIAATTVCAIRKGRTLQKVVERYANKLSY